MQDGTRTLPWGWPKLHVCILLQEEVHSLDHLAPCPARASLLANMEGAHAFRGHSSPRSYPDVKMIHASARQAFFENSSTGAVLHCPDNLLTTLHCLRPMRDTSSLCALKPPHPLQSVYCRHFTHKLWLLLKMCTGQFEVWGAPPLTLIVVLLLQICSINQNFPWFFLKIE